MELSTILTLIATVVYIVLLGLFVALIALAVRAFLKYLKSNDVRKEKAATRKSLGETLAAHRTRCKMTQEFVAESLGVSRQAVSKWENGTSDPSTSNLLAAAKLYGVSAEEFIERNREITLIIETMFDSKACLRYNLSRIY
ncbi:MAG: helix-turn-helix domain-containing protein [Lachnospiraceae bacterium]|jgi:DNA-binding XRE family transcriptional regulator|nr:helix-turn-helix domain-containing protein [Lachnospiraceae bacterium]